MTTKTRIALVILSLLAPVAARAQTPPTNIASKQITYSKTEGDFKAGYTYDMSVTATQASAGNSTVRSTNAAVWASVFDYRKDFIRNEIKATTNTSQLQPAITRRIYFLGMLKKNPGWTLPVVGDLDYVTHEQKLATVSKAFMVGPVPMYVSVDVYANSVLRAGGTLTRLGGDFYMRPTSGLGTEVSVGVGIDDIANFGVAGDLNLLSLTPYATTDARWSYKRNSCPGGANEDTLVGSGALRELRHVLDGELMLFAEIAWQRWEKTIFNYGGVHSSNELIYSAPQSTLVFPALGPAPEGISLPPSSCGPRPIAVPRALPSL